MTFWETVERGEYVMIAEAVLLILCVCIWWIRSIRLGSQSKKYSPLMQRVRDHVVEGDIENARQLCSASPSPGAAVIESGLSHLGKSMLEIRAAISQVSQIEKESMGRGSRWLRAIAVIAPLLGLGGTLVGVIDRLRELGVAGASVDIAAVCDNIAPTIVTTVAGLGVGVFALVAFTFLEGRIDSSRRKLDMVANEFTDLLNEPAS